MKMISDRKETPFKFKSRILNDYILMEVFQYTDIKDLFRWIRISQQFSDCIHRVLKISKRLVVANSTEYICDSFDYKFFMYFKEEEPLHENDYIFNNIESAIFQKSNLYYMNQSLSNLMTISDKCQRIHYLALKDCYLDESVLQFTGDLKNLKSLLLFECLFPKTRFETFCQTLENSTKNVTNLTLLQLNFIEDISIDFESYIPSLVFSFKHLKELNLMINNSDIIEEILQKSSNLNLIGLVRDNMTVISRVIPIEFHNLLNALNLKYLYIKDFPITKQMLETIISSLFLKGFSLCCPEFECSLLIDLAEKHKDLKYLRIYWSIFIGDITTKTSILFENVSRFKFHQSDISPDQFNGLIQLFPRLRVFQFSPFYSIICCQNNSDRNCQMCENLCFDLIPVLPTLRKFVIGFWSIRKSFLQCINRFPNLVHLQIYGYYSLNETRDQLDSYDSYFTQIVELLIDFCNENPTMVLRLEIDTELIAVPPYLKLPKNLIILRNILY